MTLYLDRETGGYIALCPELPGVSAFGETREVAVRELSVAVALAIETYVAESWPLPAAEEAPDPALPSGEFRVRIPRRLHAQLARLAKQEGVSQNYLVGIYLAQGVTRAEGRWDDAADERRLDASPSVSVKRAARGP